MLTKYPNGKFAPATQRRLREIQETLAEAEMVAGDYYYNKGALAAATNRLTGLVGQYPLLAARPKRYGWMATRIPVWGLVSAPKRATLTPRSCAIIR